MFFRERSATSTAGGTSSPARIATYEGNSTEKLRLGDLRLSLKCSIGHIMTAKKEICAQSAFDVSQPTGSVS
jgi:hypothetical protein